MRTKAPSLTNIPLFCNSSDEEELAVGEWGGVGAACFRENTKAAREQPSLARSLVKLWSGSRAVRSSTPWPHAAITSGLQITNRST